MRMCWPRWPASVVEASGTVGQRHPKGPRPLNKNGERIQAHLRRIGLFWAGEWYPGPTESFNNSGRGVAAAAWTRALVRYAQVPSVDVFAPLHMTGATRHQLLGVPGWGSDPSATDTQFYGEADLPARCAAHTYDVFHSPDGLDFTQASYLRSRYARRVFPVTCPQYGISYTFDLHPAFIPLFTAQIYPCDAIVCLTRSSRRAMEKRLTDIAERYASAWQRPVPRLPRLELIPCGVDTQVFAPRDSAVARRELNLPLDRPILLCISRVRIQDKMDYTPLLLAFQHVCRTVERPPLLILAGAADRQYSDRVLTQAEHLGIHEAITTFFNLPAACLPSLYAAADVFVSPTDSPSESFGLTIIEAMACGRPVVASDWDGYQELIVHGKTGFKVRADWADCLGELDRMGPLLPWGQQHLHVGQSVSVDVGEMASYLKQLLCNAALREEMGRRGRARVLSLYDWPVVIRQWEAMWAELSQIAARLEPQQPDGLDYLEPHYFQHFSHYASRIVSDSTPVRITERGGNRLAGREPFYLHPWATGYLQVDHLQAALTALEGMEQRGGAQQVGEWVTALHDREGLSRDQALRHVMWLAKYDLVSFAPD